MNDVYITRGERLAARKVEGEMIILAADDSSLYVLNEVATAIWEAADGRTSLQSIVDRVVCGRYDVDAQTGLIDARELVDALASHGILSVTTEPAA